MKVVISIYRFEINIVCVTAGVPPIHTPVSVLAALPEDVKNRLYLVHTSKKSVPGEMFSDSVILKQCTLAESGLKIAPEGVENTIALNVTPHVHADAIELLKVVDSIDMFRVFTIAQAREVLQNAVPRHFKSGSTIITKGTDGNEFYIITAGIIDTLFS
jgi:hypothetical protein